MLLFCILFTASLGNAWGAGDASFSQAVHQALASNPKVLAAKSTLAATREKYEQSLGALLPEVAFNASHSRYSDTWTDTTNGQTPNRFNLNMVQPLYRRQLWLALQQTQPLIGAAEEDYRAVLQAVFLETVQSMVSVLLTENMEKLAQDNLLLTHRNLEAAVTRRQAGDLTRTDVDQATARVASAEAELIRAKNDAMVARARFEETVGIPVPEGLAIPDVLPHLLHGTLEELSARRTHRPDLRAAELRMASADVAVEIEKAGHLPYLDLQANAVTFRGGSGPNADLINGENQYNVAVQLTVPLYSGGKTMSRTREALGMREVRQSEWQRVDKQSLREISQAHLLMRSAKATVASAEAAVKFSQAAVKGLEEEFAAGFRTVTQLFELQNQLFRSETDLVKNRYELVSSQYQLLHTLGRLTVEDIELPGPEPREASPERDGVKEEDDSVFKRFIDSIKKPLSTDLLPVPSQPATRTEKSQPVRSRLVQPASQSSDALLWTRRLGERFRQPEERLPQSNGRIALPDRPLDLTMSRGILSR
ncbi:MAG: TolC family outer membrane protein [Magnetococcus sp. XQGC-1]